MTKTLLSVLFVLPMAAAEPAPRTLPPAALETATALGHVTAVTELADGRLLISDHRGARLLVVDATGAVKPLGSAGAGELQYAQPAGFYRGPDGTTTLLDRAGPRAVVISAKGELIKSYSVAEKGVQRSSDADRDWMRLDQRGLTYFAQTAFGASATTKDLIRMDPATQKKDVIAKLMLPETRYVSGGDGMTFSRATIGSPADDWAVASDGRVAVVRAKPYRVDWVGIDGKITQGPEIPFDPISYTDADRQAVEARSKAGGGVGVGRGGDRTSGGELGLRMTDTKPAFFPNAVTISPAGQVWVPRAMPFGATTTIFDVFNSVGARVDRVMIPLVGSIAGFGAGSVYIRGGEGASETLRKYRLR